MDDYSSPKKMKQISELFIKYKLNLKAPQATVEKICLEVIYDISNLKLDSKSVSYSPVTRTIQIKAPSVVKSELGFYKKEIMMELKKRIGSTCPEEII